jgi:hypothetical protein
MEKGKRNIKKSPTRSNAIQEWDKWRFKWPKSKFKWTLFGHWRKKKRFAESLTN